MIHQNFQIGAHVRLLWDIQTVQRETTGRIVQRYHMALGLYDVLFAGASEPIVVHARYLELLPNRRSMRDSSTSGST